MKKSFQWYVRDLLLDIGWLGFFPLICFCAYVCVSFCLSLCMHVTCALNYVTARSDVHRLNLSAVWTLILKHSALQNFVCPSSFRNYLCTRGVVKTLH